MQNSPSLLLPYILPSQAQKHVTYNEAVRMLDALVQANAASDTLAAPPAEPAEGEAYIVAGPASGAWAGREGDLAAYQDGAWAFFAPSAGWRVWVQDAARLRVFDGSAWIDIFERVETLGISADADATNRLAVSSPATLLNNAGAGHQLKINKNAAGDTASLLFQTGWSGRAEMGTAGSDDFSVKVSPDGAAWGTALAVHTDSSVRFPGIGTTANAANAYLDSADGHNLLRVTSSARYKTDVQALEISRAMALMGVKPVRYRSLAASDNSGWSWYGFIAEEVAGIDPRMVHWGYGPDDYETIETTDQDGGARAERRLRPGAELKPQSVAYDRFAVIHQAVLDHVLQRLDALEGVAASQPGA